MKKFNLLAVAAGLLILGAPAASFAEDTNDNKPASKISAEDREKLKNMTPQERREWIQKNHPEFAKRMEQQRGEFMQKNKEVFERAGVKQDEIKDLSPAEKRAKVKEAVDKRVADLEKKKSDGTALTEQEQSDLETLQRVKTMMDHQGQGGPRRGAKGQKPASNDNK